MFKHLKLKGTKHQSSNVAATNNCHIDCYGSPPVVSLCYAPIDDNKPAKKVTVFACSRRNPTRTKHRHCNKTGEKQKTSNR